MGYALARVCRRRGAKVTLVSGKTNLEPPYGVEFVPVKSAEDMFEAVTTRAAQQDIIIKAAAVADYRPAQVAENKIHKSDDDMSIHLERTKDILAWLGTHRREGQVLCGFAMETEHMVEHAQEKLTRKHVRYDRCKQCKSSRSRIRNGYECGDVDYGRRRTGA